MNQKEQSQGRLELALTMGNRLKFCYFYHSYYFSFFLLLN